MSSRTSLGAAADARKARLAALKNMKRKAPSDEQLEGSPRPAPPAPERSTSPQASNLNALTIQDEDQQQPSEDISVEDQEVTQKYLSGRNFDAATAGPKLGFVQNPAAEQETLEKRAAELQAEAKAKAAEEEKQKEIDISSLQPKKPNWDLKRDLAAKMRVLDVRTDNVVAQLVRERIVQQKAAKQGANGGNKQGEEIGLKGQDLVEGMRLAEKELEEEERREREAEMV